MPPFDLIGILIIAAALIAAIVLGALVSTFVSAVIWGLVVWVVFIIVWYIWGPPLPYTDWTSLGVVLVGWAIGLSGVAALARGAKRAYERA